MPEVVIQLVKIASNVEKQTAVEINTISAVEAKWSRFFFRIIIYIVIQMYQWPPLL